MRPSFGSSRVRQVTSALGGSRQCKVATLKGRRAMTTLMTRVRPTRTEVDEFFRETYPLPVAALALAGLLLDDVAVVVAAIAAMG